MDQMGVMALPAFTPIYILDYFQPIVADYYPTFWIVVLSPKSSENAGSYCNHTTARFLQVTNDIFFYH